MKITKKELKKMEKKKDVARLKIWADTVKLRDDFKCVISGETERLNAHHIIPREIKAFRYDVDNGISLSPKHHQFSREISAHANPFAFHEWFIDNRPEQYLRLKKKWIEFNKLKGGEE